MKRILPLLLALILALSMFSGCALAEKAALTDGEYTATVDGRNGPLTITVAIEGGAIKDIVVGDNEETPASATRR